MPRTQAKTDGSLALSEAVEPLADPCNVRTKKPTKPTGQKPVKPVNISKVVPITTDGSALTVLVTNSNSIIEIPLGELHAPEFSPFNIVDNEAMDRLVDSIEQHGVHEPGLARPRPKGGYELLIGQRRKRACELAHIPTLPVVIRELDNNSAIIAMVDSNLEQRDRLLPSEKAWAYRIKLDALYHKGAKGGKLSAEIIAEQTGESRNQIFRYIRLTELVIGLLDKVDANKIAFNPAVEISYLSQAEQVHVVSAMEKYEIKPSLSQAVRLKKLKQAGELTLEMIDTVISEARKISNPQKETGRFRKFFPANYTHEQMEVVIIRLLTDWKASENVQDNTGKNQDNGDSTTGRG
jgi:ParB family chromosome partitioning protein